jgi:hypothetical protein
MPALLDAPPFEGPSRAGRGGNALGAGIAGKLQGCDVVHQAIVYDEC